MIGLPIDPCPDRQFLGESGPGRSGTIDRDAHRLSEPFHIHLRQEEPGDEDRSDLRRQEPASGEPEEPAREPAPPKDTTPPNPPEEASASREGMVSGESPQLEKGGSEKQPEAERQPTREDASIPKPTPQHAGAGNIFDASPDPRSPENATASASAPASPSAAWAEEVPERPGEGSAEAVGPRGDDLAQSARGDKSALSACGDESPQSACGDESPQSARGDEFRRPTRKSAPPRLIHGDGRPHTEGRPGQLTAPDGQIPADPEPLAAGEKPHKSPPLRATRPDVGAGGGPNGSPNLRSAENVAEPAAASAAPKAPRAGERSGETVAAVDPLSANPAGSGQAVRPVEERRLHAPDRIPVRTDTPSPSHPAPLPGVASWRQSDRGETTGLERLANRFPELAEMQIRRSEGTSPPPERAGLDRSAAHVIARLGVLRMRTEPDANGRDEGSPNRIREGRLAAWRSEFSANAVVHRTSLADRPADVAPSVADKSFELRAASVPVRSPPGGLMGDGTGRDAESSPDQSTAFVSIGSADGSPTRPAAFAVPGLSTARVGQEQVLEAIRIGLGRLRQAGGMEAVVSLRSENLGMLQIRIIEDGAALQVAIQSDGTFRWSDPDGLKSQVAKALGELGYADVSVRVGVGADPDSASDSSRDQAAPGEIDDVKLPEEEDERQS